WTSLNGDLQDTEFYFDGLAYDSLNHILIGGAQDVGSSQQSAPGSTTWDALNLADGGGTQTAIIDGFSVRYSSSQALGGGPGGFRRRIYDSNNVLVADEPVDLYVLGQGDLYSVDHGLQF